MDGDEYEYLTSTHGSECPGCGRCEHLEGDCPTGGCDRCVFDDRAHRLAEPAGFGRRSFLRFAGVAAALAAFFGFARRSEAAPPPEPVLDVPILCDDGCGAVVGMSDRPQQGHVCHPCAAIRTEKHRAEHHRVRAEAEAAGHDAGEARILLVSSGELHPAHRQVLQEIVDAEAERIRARIAARA